MKLLALTVQELYGCYNYIVNFNADVTFIYGANGCGKTTILNITEAIITGQLFKIFDYKFKRIELTYAKSTDLNSVEHITIIQQKSKLNVEFNNQKFVVEIGDSGDNIHSPEKNIRDIVRYYFNRYEFLLEIKKTFNYVYLPLNRSTMAYEYDEDYYMMRRYRNRMPIDVEMHFGSDSRDIAMMQIETLINMHYSKINSVLSKYNDDFRNEILKSLLEIHRTYDISDSINEILQQRNTISSLQKTKNAYINMLKELDLLTKAEEENYTAFFAAFINEFTTFQKNKFENVPIELLLKFQEISKIKNLLDIAEKMEQRKALAKKPIETFLNTMNSFIENSEDGKTIKIDSMGHIFFYTKYNSHPISIQYLSSGEKQLITFFANLIFSVKSNSSGIFVVDEPELSLHLSWQKIFVEKMLDINKNIQLIFATHSPEIIGRHRDKMYRLEKQYVKAAIKHE